MVNGAEFEPNRYAILFADIVNSTVLNSQRQDDDYRTNILFPLLEIQFNNVKLHCGARVGTPDGDKIMAVFVNPDDALQAAIFIQRDIKLWNENAGRHGADKINVRIGIHYSEQILHCDNQHLFCGHMDCSYAARVMSIADGGQIVVSEGMRQRPLHKGYDWKVWPDRRVKSLNERPVHVFTLTWGGGNDHKEPGTARIPTWIRDMNRYIPRVQIENQVLNGFKDEGENGGPLRLITLHGAGGTGKTRLALHCCLFLLPAFESNVHFVSLDKLIVNSETDTLGRTRLLSAAIGKSFMLDEKQATPENLPFCIPHKKCLVLLDNYETVACKEAGMLITRLVCENPKLYILITGRADIENPEIELRIPVDDMTPTQSRKLLHDRLGLPQGNTQWKPEKADLPYVNKILALIGGHPLSIELAAAHIASLSLKDIACGLEDTLLGEMTSRSESAVSHPGLTRHHSLSLCLTWSWSLLKLEDQRALACLSLYAAPFHREEVEGCFPSDSPGNNCVTFASISRLLHYALLRKETSDSGDTLFYLLPSTREFAQEKNVAFFEGTNTITAFVSYYAERMQAHWSKVINHDLPAMRLMDRVWRNANAAFGKALTGGEYDKAEAIHNTLAHYLLFRAKYAEAVVLTERMKQSRLERLPKGHVRIADSMNWVAFVYNAQGLFKQAEELYFEALELYRSQAELDHLAIATNLHNIGLLYQHQGRYSEALISHKEALQLRRTYLPEHHQSIAQTAHNLAFVLAAQSRFDEAEELYFEALTIRRLGLGDKHPFIAEILNNLATLHAERGRLTEAEYLYYQALDLRVTHLSKNHPSIAISLSNLAALFERQNRNSEAEKYYKEALSVRSATLPEHHPLLLSSLDKLGKLYEKMNNFSDALAIYRRTLKLFESASGPLKPETLACIESIQRCSQEISSR